MYAFHRLVLGLLALSPTFALASDQTFDFVIDRAQSSSTLYYNSQDDYPYWMGSDYLLNYAVSGTFTMELVPTVFESIKISKSNIKAEWVSATPLDSNPAWPPSKLPREYFRNIPITFNNNRFIESYFDRETGEFFFAFTEPFDSYKTFGVRGILNGNNVSFNGEVACYDYSAGICENPLRLTLTAHVVPLPGTSLLFLSGLSALFIKRRQAFRELPAIHAKAEALLRH